MRIELTTFPLRRERTTTMLRRQQHSRLSQCLYLIVCKVLKNQRTGFNIEPQFYKDFIKNWFWNVILQFSQILKTWSNNLSTIELPVLFRLFDENRRILRKGIFLEKKRRVHLRFPKPFRKPKPEGFFLSPKTVHKKSWNEPKRRDKKVLRFVNFSKHWNRRLLRDIKKNRTHDNRPTMVWILNTCKSKIIIIIKTKSWISSGNDDFAKTLQLLYNLIAVMDFLGVK